MLTTFAKHSTDVKCSDKGWTDTGHKTWEDKVTHPNCNQPFFMTKQILKNKHLGSWFVLQFLKFYLNKLCPAFIASF